MEEAYLNLISAIVEQALKDFREASGRLREDPRDFEAQRILFDVKQFLRSDWFAFLCDYDGEWLIEKMESSDSHSKTIYRKKY